MPTCKKNMPTCKKNFIFFFFFNSVWGNPVAVLYLLLHTPQIFHNILLLILIVELLATICAFFININQIKRTELAGPLRSSSVSKDPAVQNKPMPAVSTSADILRSRLYYYYKTSFSVVQIFYNKLFIIIFNPLALFQLTNLAYQNFQLFFKEVNTNPMTPITISKFYSNIIVFLIRLVGFFFVFYSQYRDSFNLGYSWLDSFTLNGILLFHNIFMLPLLASTFLYGIYKYRSYKFSNKLESNSQNSIDNNSNFFKTKESSILSSNSNFINKLNNPENIKTLFNQNKETKKN